MRPTTFIGLMGLVIVGVILADIWANPTGTSAAWYSNMSAAISTG